MTEFVLAVVAACAVPVIGLVVAVLVIRGPARWTAGAGLLMMVVTSALSILLPLVIARLGAPTLFLALWGMVSMVGWALLALSVIHATLWARRQPSRSVPTQTYR